MRARPRTSRVRGAVPPHTSLAGPYRPLAVPTRAAARVWCPGSLGPPAPPPLKRAEAVAECEADEIADEIVRAHFDTGGLGVGGFLGTALRGRRRGSLLLA